MTRTKNQGLLIYNPETPEICSDELMVYHWLSYCHLLQAILQSCQR